MRYVDIAMVKDLELRGGRVGEPGRGWGKGELGSGGLVW